MTKFDTHWETMVAELAVDYTRADGKAASCGLIAVIMARMLHAEDKEPRILYLQSPGTTVETVFQSKIVPRPYGGRHTWMYHVVCLESGMVCDPILPTPQPFEKYSVPAFDLSALAVAQDYLWTPPVHTEEIASQTKVSV